MELRLFQSIAGVGSIILTAVILELIRRRKLKDELWVPWLIVGIAPLVASLWMRPWAAVAHWLEIAYEPALLLGSGIVLCVSMILYLTVVLSSLMRQNIRLAQDIAMLQARVEAARTL